jgi:hypothetical protein
MFSLETICDIRVYFRGFRQLIVLVIQFEGLWLKLLNFVLSNNCSIVSALTVVELLSIVNQ